MSPRHVAYAAIDELAGTELGCSDWLTIDQATVDTFGALTGDNQWIHTDVARAAAGPFGHTVAHGFLTLATLPSLTRSVIQVSDVNTVINYGLNRVRFIRPLPVGARIRDRIRLTSVVEAEYGKRVTLIHTIELEDDDVRPVCVAETVSLFTPVDLNGASSG